MKKFFVVGCPRSGTTMLQQALNRHSQIVVPPETKYFFSFLGHSGGHQIRHLRRINADLRIEVPTPPRRVCSTHAARAVYEQIAELYVRRLDREGVAYFGEKTPEHTGYLWHITHLFPGAKIVFLYRDGRDVALSLTRVPWMTSDLYANFMVWLYYYRIQVRACCDQSLNLHLVRYEDLVVNPEAELRKVLAFLGLSYEPAVRECYGNSEGIPEREYPWKARALGRITDEYIGTWRRELSPLQVANLERLGGWALRSLGYKLTTDGEGGLSLAFYLRLCWNLLALLPRLPFRTVVNELFGRFFYLDRRFIG